MKCVKVELPKELKSINIEVFADLHIGSPKCNYQLIQERIEKVKNSPNTYVILLGDIINNSTRNSVGDVYEEELSPMETIKVAVRTLEPINDRIIGATTGNHERRSYKTEGIDLTFFLCSELGIVDKYDPTACLLFIRFGWTLKQRKNCYSLYMTHGDGNGGKTVGGKANGLQKRGQIVDADIVVTGHTHSPLTFRDCAYKIDYMNSTITKFEQLFINASATLDYENYAELYGMHPSSTVSPTIVLDGRKKQMNTIM